jgi:hypothetical protein
MQGFVPWDSWVPLPYPFKEVQYAREMFSRGERLVVQTPDFVDFANDLSFFTSRNSLIAACKKMLFMRGVRTNIKLGLGGEQKEYYVTVECARGGKASAHIRN